MTFTICRAFSMGMPCCMVIFCFTVPPAAGSTAPYVNPLRETPRFTKFNPAGNDVLIESRVPAAALRELTEMGHEVAVRREYTQEMGRGQAILHDSESGTNYAASDPRADGAATPEPIVS